MSQVENEHVVIDGDYSLAALAELDTSEYKALTSRLPMAGIWTVMMMGVNLSQLPPKEDKAPVPVIQFRFEALNIEPLIKDPNLDPASLVGRRLTDRATLWTNSEQAFRDEVGIVMGNYQKIGFPNKGRLGGATEQGAAPGWLDQPVIAQTPFQIRVRHGQRNGQDTAYIDWLGPVKDGTAEA